MTDDRSTPEGELAEIRADLRRNDEQPRSSMRRIWWDGDIRTLLALYDAQGAQLSALQQEQERLKAELAETAQFYNKKATDAKILQLEAERHVTSLTAERDVWLEERECLQLAIADYEQEIAQLRALTTWQPIETAPKDGTHILVAFASIGVYQVFWSEQPYCPGVGGWCVTDNKYEDRPLRGYPSEADAKGWMPLPAAHAGPREET